MSEIGMVVVVKGFEEVEGFGFVVLKELEGFVD